MRKLLYIAILALALLVQPMKIWASGEIGDSIWIDGRRYELLLSPFEVCPVKDSVIPSNVATSPYDWDGYEAFWSLRDGELYLDSIHYCTYDLFVKEGNCVILLTISPNLMELPELAPWRTDAGIRADWVSGVLRVVSGKTVLYYNIGFYRFHEEETYYAIDEGRLVAQERVTYSKSMTEGEMNEKMKDVCDRLFSLVK